MNDLDQVLDTTSENISEETAVETVEQQDKPKRGRRSKAQIEADKLAAEAAAQTVSEESSKVSSEATEDTATAAEVAAPEVIEDTETDALPDITESEDAASNVESTSEGMVPEVVEDTPIDALPDVVEPRVVAPKKIHPSGEAVEAFQEKTVKTDPNSLIGKSYVLTNATPMYRARHISMRLKSYRGQVTVVEDDRAGFVKVQFLRQGFGLCEGFVATSDLLKGEGVDYDESKEQEERSE